MADIKEWATRALAAVNKYPIPLMPQAQVEQVVRSLRPIAPGMELIRLGPEGDGGYLVPDDLDGIGACFSPGVWKVSGFEYDCAERGMNVFLADNSVDAPAVAHARFVFTKKNVGAVTRADFISLDDWVDAALPHADGDLLLQMDIEGYEYETLLGMSEQLLKRFRIMVIEFHQVDWVWSAAGFRYMAPTFQKILRHHTCVHLHPNNCCGVVTRGKLEIPRLMEFTFLRNDRVRAKTFAKTFPHPLDRDNTGEGALPLPACWYADARGTT